MNGFFCDNFYLHVLLLEAIPVEGGIGLHPWTIEYQRNQNMTLQRDRVKITRKRLPVDEGLPPIRLIQLTGIVQLRESFLPDIEEVSEGKGTSAWSLNVDHTVAGVRVQPVEA